MSATAMAECSDSVIAMLDLYTANGNCRGVPDKTISVPAGQLGCQPLEPHALSVNVTCVGKNPTGTAERYSGK